MVNRVLLKEIAKITTGSSAPKEKYFSNNGLPFIRAGHLEALIESNKINELPKIDEETGKKLKLKKVGKGTILFAKSGMSSKKNRVYICTDNAYIVSHLAAIIPNSNLVNNSYLKYYLEWYKPSRLIIDESYPSIRTTDIGNIEINLPSLESQLRIVKILDQVRALIKKRKAQIEALDQLTQSVFLEMFGDPLANPKGWPKVTLKDHICKVNKINLKNSKDKIKYIDISSIDNNKNKITSYTEYIGIEAPSRAKQVVQKGDILVSTVRPNLKNVAMVFDNFDNLICSTGFCVIRCTDKLNNNFIFHLVKSDSFTKNLVRKTTGANYPAVKNSDIYNESIIYPPIELQEKFSSITKQIEEKKTFLEKSLFYQEELFNSLLQKAFKGELFTVEKVLKL